MVRYCVVVTDLGAGSSNPKQLAFSFPPVQDAQVSDETLVIPPNLGLMGINGTVVVVLPVEPLAPDAVLDGFGPPEPVPVEVGPPVSDATLVEEAEHTLSESLPSAMVLLDPATGVVVLRKWTQLRRRRP